MALLAGTNYDPGTAGSVSTASNLAMTAIDTTNLRLNFTVPADGKVLVRMRGTVHGATTFPQILMGVLQSSTVIGRQAPVGGLKTTALATSQVTQEAMFCVSGLTPGASLTWDAAYGVEVLIASTAIKYGGPNNTTTNDAFGGFSFEVWDMPTLLATTLYDPAAAVTKSTTALLAMTAVDTTNLRLGFTVPSTGRVMVRLRVPFHGSTTLPSVLLGVLESATVKGRQSPLGAVKDTAAATGQTPQEALFVVTGLTPLASLNWDAAYGVEIVSAAGGLKYGGPNDTTTDNAFGGFLFEIYEG